MLFSVRWPWRAAVRQPSVYSSLLFGKRNISRLHVRQINPHPGEMSHDVLNDLPSFLTELFQLFRLPFFHHVIRIIGAPVEVGTGKVQYKRRCDDFHLDAQESVVVRQQPRNSESKYLFDVEFSEPKVDIAFALIQLPNPNPFIADPIVVPSTIPSYPQPNRSSGFKFRCFNNEYFSTRSAACCCHSSIYFDILFVNHSRTAPIEFMGVNRRKLHVKNTKWFVFRRC